jgi:hypothetical protein
MIDDNGSGWDDKSEGFESSVGITYIRVGLPITSAESFTA